MSTKNPEYYTYRPSKLKVSRLGVNISQKMNDNLNLDTSQYMIVGEHYVNQNGSTSNTYSLIVDEDGIAVNTSLDHRQQNRNDYPVQLHGTVYIDGNVIITGVIAGSNSSNILGGTSNFWNWAGNNNIYYDGKVNIGNYEDANENQYSLHIAEPSNKDINKAQLAIENRQLSELRMAILGSASNSPVIWNTPEKTPLEFHVGRKKPYFDPLYYRSYSNEYDEWVENEPTDTPQYKNIFEAPHLNIDENGNVGIRTSFNPKIPYILRKTDPQYPDAIVYPSVYEPMSLHVEGPMYASNILIYDYESSTPKNLDELFIRKLGETIYACNIIPGYFSRGYFEFRSNVAIMTCNVDEFALLVNGNIKTTSNLYIEGNVYNEGDFEGENIYIRNNGSFSNNVVVQNNIYFKANLFKERTNPETGSNEWAMIQFDSSFFPEQSFSNIYYIGDGIATVGRMGVGVIPNRDEVNHQFVVRKRDSSIYEIELTDRNERLDRTAYIGHPNVHPDRREDASLVFVTPGPTDVNYNKFYNYAPQNIYFYAGYERTISTFQIENSNAPTLGVFTGKRVGINTFNPQEALDVHGNIQVDGDLYFKRTDLLDPIKLGLWKARHYSFIDAGPNIYDGIEYFDESAPHVGINTIAQSDYGLVVGGKVMSLDGYYTREGYKFVPWYEPRSFRNKPLPPVEDRFSMGKVAVGLRVPEATLHLKDTSSATSLKLSQGNYTPSTILQMEGMSHNYMFHLQDMKNILEIYYGNSNEIYTSSSNRPLILKKGLQHQMIINSNHSLLTNDTDVLLVNGNMKVFGDINVTGQYKINAAGIQITNSQAEYSPSDNPDDIFIAGADILMNPNQSQTKGIFIGYDEEQLNNYKSSIYYSPLNVLQRADNPAYLVSKFTSIGETAVVQLESIKKNVVLNFGITEYNDLSFFTNQNRSRPLFAFQNDGIGGYSVGFGTTQPVSAQVQIFTDYMMGSNLLKITKRTNVDSPGAGAGMTFEKVIGTDTYQWAFMGPEESYEQKLSLYYKDSTLDKELFTFAKNGCFGIGHSEPTFAIDIATGELGSIRMLQSDPAVAKPQLLFQSGSNQYGADYATDFRMYAYSNNFYLDMQDIRIGQKPLFHFTSNTALGIHQQADSRYNVSINGTLNVSRDIYLNGRQIFSAGDAEADLGTFIRGINIFMIPEVSKNGGIVFNHNGATSNLFYIASGRDGNMMVLDSEFPEAQIQFRNREEDNTRHIYRLASSNESFILEYNSNNIYDTREFNDKHTGFLRVVEWTPVEKNKFDMSLDANIRMDKNLDPNIYLRTSTIGHSNTSLYLLPETGVSVGTKFADAKFHVYNEDAVMPTLLLKQSGTGALMRLIQNESEKLVIDKDGRIGVGVKNPRAAIEASGAIFVNNGSQFLPTYSFRETSNTGLFLDGSLNLNTTTNGVTRMTVERNGNIGIGTTTIGAHVHLYNENTTVLRLATSNANLLECFNETVRTIIDKNGNIGIGTTIAISPLTINGISTFIGDILPSSNITYNLGSSNLRWKDLYISGNTIDVNDICIQKTNEGAFKFNHQSNDSLVGLVSKTLQLEHSDVEHTIFTKDESSTVPYFVTNNIATGLSETYKPIVLNTRLNTIGIGTDASSGILHIYSNSNIPTVSLQSDGAGHALQIKGSDFIEIDGAFDYHIDSTGALDIGYGHQEHLGTTAIVNINENRYRHVLITNQKNEAYCHWVMQTNGVTKSVFDAYGNLGIGTGMPTAALHVEGRTELRLSDITQAALCVHGVADFNSNVYCYQNIEVTGDTICHGNTIQDSDIRIKSDLKPIDMALDKICQLTGYTYFKINQELRQTGLIAQEVQKILPEAVTEKDDGVLGLAYGNLMGLIVEGIKELKTQLDEIKTKIEK